MPVCTHMVMCMCGAHGCARPWPLRSAPTVRPPHLFGPASVGVCVGDPLLCAPDPGVTEALYTDWARRCLPMVVKPKLDTLTPYMLPFWAFDTSLVVRQVRTGETTEERPVRPAAQARARPRYAVASRPCACVCLRVVGLCMPLV
jgi:hypothetical protein